MGILRNFVNPLHLQTKRNYLERMINEKVNCTKIAKNYGKEYWDGERKFGYGGYKYIPDRWKEVAKNLISTYSLKSGSKVLDVGCGKGFLLYEMLKIEPNLKISGFDISQYAIDNSKKEIKHLLTVGKAENNFPYANNNFDLVSLDIALRARLQYKEQKRGEWLRFATPFKAMVDTDGVPHLPKLGKALGMNFIETYWSYPNAIFHPHNDFIMMVK